MKGTIVGKPGQKLKGRFRYVRVEDPKTGGFKILTLKPEEVTGRAGDVIEIEGTEVVFNGRGYVAR